MRALVIVDMQNDFMPSGALGIPRADQIIPTINQLSKRFSLVVASMDWHPKNHVSFALAHPGKNVGDTVMVGSYPQVLWPVHCIQDTFGSAITSKLDVENIQAFFHKGTDPLVDSYSTFFDNERKRSTGLENYLREKKVTEIFFVGIATEYCVLYSSFDAIDLGFGVYVVKDACMAINLDANDESKALHAMAAKGAKIISSSECLQMLGEGK